MKKIRLFPTQDGTFHPFWISESDMSLQAKALFFCLYLIPSKILPIQEELKAYTSITSSSKIRLAMKELELRGVVVFDKEIILKDKVLPKPEAEILPLKGQEKIDPPNQDVKEFILWFAQGFLERWKEPYPIKWGMDTLASKNLISTYGVEGAKLKAKMAWETDDKFLKNAGKTITLLNSMSTRLMQEQINSIAQPDKWKAHQNNTIKLGASK